MYSVRVRTNLILIRAYILKKSFVIGGKLEVNSYNPYMITLLIACGIVLLLAHYMNIMKEVMSVRGGKFYCVFTRFEGFCIQWKQK